MAANTNTNFGQAVLAARTVSRLTTRAFARAVGCSAPFVSDVEHGRRFPKDVAEWELALGLDPGALAALDPRQVSPDAMADVQKRLSKLELKFERLSRKVP